MNGFKVVLRSDDDTLLSCIVTDVDGLNTTYEVGKPASSANGPLMFFPELESARIFKRRFQGLPIEIWSCTATNCRRCYTILKEVCWRSPLLVKQWWSAEGSSIYTGPAPGGTYVADTITLIERVDQ